MTRRAQRMEPTSISRAPAERPEEIAEEISRTLGDMVEIRLPSDCDEPILGPTTRRTVREWMLEQSVEEELRAVGIKPRTTCLLYGPPGCGKTTLAHHFAARLGLVLIIASGEMIVSSALGGTGQNIHRFFAAIRKHRSSVVGFFDEFDSVATARSGDTQACGKEFNAIVTALLTNIDRHDGLFFAATNIADGLDQAIWRRFGIHIEVEIPGFDERFAIIKRYLHPFKIADETIDELCLATHGAAPSLLRQLCEGIKRSLILSPRMKRDISDIVSVVEGGGADRPASDAPAAPTLER
ncbi:AAA family ATPase [Methylocystis sp. S23]